MSDQDMPGVRLADVSSELAKLKPSSARPVKAAGLAPLTAPK
jgi:hypothetical protein